MKSIAGTTPLIGCYPISDIDRINNSSLSYGVAGNPLGDFATLRATKGQKSKAKIKGKSSFLFCARRSKKNQLKITCSGKGEALITGNTLTHNYRRA